MKEKRSKKIALACLIAFMSLAALTGCSAEEAPAGEIVNEAPTGKVVVNFEGVVAAVNGDEVTLENGQVILITDDTVFSIPGGVVENVILSEGYNIQGYAEDETAATRIHIMSY